MCGIIGYSGPNKPLPILIGGLSRLEYRGYDSAGIAISDGETLTIEKKEGKSISKIFQVSGEAYFRDIEQKITPRSLSFFL